MVVLLALIALGLHAADRRDTALQPRAVQAAEIFGNDLDSCLEFLTAD